MREVFYSNLISIAGDVCAQLAAAPAACSAVRGEDTAVGEEVSTEAGAAFTAVAAAKLSANIAAILITIRTKIPLFI